VILDGHRRNHLAEDETAADFVVVLFFIYFV
jgi:hypothetical protein